MPFFTKKTRSAIDRSYKGRYKAEVVSIEPMEEPETLETRPRSVSRSFSYADEETLLLNAVAREDLASVRRVLQNEKVNINNIKNPGLAPIHHACVSGNLEIVKLLVECGADLDLHSKQGESPLQLAVTNGHFELSQYLIEEGATQESIADGVQK